MKDTHAPMQEPQKRSSSRRHVTTVTVYHRDRIKGCIYTYYTNYPTVIGSGQYPNPIEKRLVSMVSSVLGYSITPLEVETTYRVYGDLIILYPQPYSIYLRGTIPKSLTLNPKFYLLKGGLYTPRSSFVSQAGHAATENTEQP